MNSLTRMTILMLLTGLLFAQGTRMTYGPYEMQANAFLKTKNGKLALTAVRPVNETKEESMFGYWLSAKAAGTETVIDIKEGQRSLATVTAKDFASKARIEAAGPVTNASYTVERGAVSLTLVLSSEVIAEPGLPAGSAIRYTLSARSSAAKTLSAEITLQADGFVQKVGANGISSSRVEKAKPVYPFVLAFGDAGTTLSAEKGDPKVPGRAVRFTGSAVPVTTEPSVLVSFRTLVTTVSSTEKALTQSNNIESLISGKKPKTEMALMNTASKANPVPGDTITYSITYHNIGTSPAEELTISNPIPANTMYVDKSAEGKDTEITLERKKVNLPQIGAVTSVSWKVKKRINPGEEGTVSLRAVIQ